MFKLRCRPKGYPVPTSLEKYMRVWTNVIALCYEDGQFVITLAHGDKFPLPKDCEVEVWE